MRLKYAVKIAAIKAAYTQLGVTTQPSISVTAGIFQAQRLSANVQTLNRILADAREGNFIYFAKYFDTFYVKDGARPSDEMVFELFRYLADDSDVADLYIAEFNKIVGDSVGISDIEDFTKDFHRPLVDVPVVDEAYATSFQKSRADGFSATDDAAKLHPNKVASETTYFSDGIYTLDFGKFEQDGVPLTDLYRVAYAKPTVADVFSVSDTDRRNVDKPLFEAVFIPDDYVVLFTKKVPDDPLVLSEQLIKDLARVLGDAFGVTEAHALELGKVVSDQVAGIGDYVFLLTKKAPDSPVAVGDLGARLGSGKATTDATAVADTLNTIGLQKPQEDSAAAVDVNTTATTKQLTDDVSFTDDVDGEASILDDQEIQFVKQRTDTTFLGDSIYIQRVYIRDFSHAAATADDALFAVWKTLSDTSGASDSTNRVTGKHIYDMPVAADTLAFAFTSARTDSAFFGDVNEVAFNKTLLELTSTADTGSLRSQGYCDFTYFAEDYVGASRIF